MSARAGRATLLGGARCSLRGIEPGGAAPPIDVRDHSQAAASMPCAAPPLAARRPQRRLPGASPRTCPPSTVHACGTSLGVAWGAWGACIHRGSAPEQPALALIRRVVLHSRQELVAQSAQRYRKVPAVALIQNNIPESGVLFSQDGEKVQIVLHAQAALGLRARWWTPGCTVIHGFVAVGMEVGMVKVYGL